MAIQTLNTIKKWFQTGLKPSQDQFWDTWDSFRHKNEKVPLRDIENLATTLDSKAEKSELENHKTDSNAHSELFNTKEDKENKGIANGYVPLDAFSKIANQYLSIVNDLVSGGSSSILSAEQGKILQNQINGIQALLKSDNVNLNTLQKIVDTIEEVQISLSTILVNDLTTGGVTKALTAEMGKILQSSKEDKSQKGIANGYAPLNSFTKLASQYLDIVNDLVSGGSSSLLSAEQGKILQNQINGINTLLQSDNVNLDTLQEIVDAIEEVQISLSTILVNDLTTGGATKALTAEMGKKLNDIKLTATIATDAETQIAYSNSEDNKVISRFRLFNWWNWIKSQVQNIPAIWKFTGVKVGNSTGNYVYTAEIFEDKFVTKLVSLGYGTYSTEYGYTDIKSYGPYGYYTKIAPASSNTQNNNIIWPNKSGTVALINDFITTATGTTTTAPLNIPNGVLTTVPQNGAIERDGSGNLWETHSGVRSKLITSTDGLILVAYKSLNTIQTNLDTNISSTIQNTSSSSVIGKIGNDSVLNLNLINQLINSQVGTVKPTVAKVEVFLKINNGLFATYYAGSNTVNQVKILEYSGSNMVGNKIYKNPIFTVLQSSDPLKSQWSSIDLVLESVVDGISTSTGKTYYLRDSTNSRTFGASEASFSFVFVNTLMYADATNSAGQNGSTLLRNTNYGLYLETIR